MATQVGTNVRFSSKDGLLTIVIDTTKNSGKSKTGASYLVGSSGGFQDVGDGVSLNLNCIRIIPKADR